MKGLENLMEIVEDLIILAINAEMRESEETRVLAANVRSLAEKMENIILELMEENHDKGINS